VSELFEERAGFNEAAFREVNEHIEASPAAGRLTFRCECARLGCTDLLELGRAEYEAVRAHPRRFLVAVGHELPAVEEVVERHDDYLVVEKHGASGGVAERADPRRD
jgi:hypothetical protein